MRADSYLVCSVKQLSSLVKLKSEALTSAMVQQQNMSEELKTHHSKHQQAKRSEKRLQTLYDTAADVLKTHQVSGCSNEPVMNFFSLAYHSG